MVIYGINRINVSLVYSVNAIQQNKYYLKMSIDYFQTCIHCLALKLILKKAKLNKGNLKNVDFCSYLGMNPHFGDTVL